MIQTVLMAVTGVAGMMLMGFLVLVFADALPVLAVMCLVTEILFCVLTVLAVCRSA